MKFAGRGPQLQPTPPPPPPRVHAAAAVHSACVALPSAAAQPRPGRGARSDNGCSVALVAAAAASSASSTAAPAVHAVDRMPRSSAPAARCPARSSPLAVPRARCGRCPSSRSPLAVRRCCPAVGPALAEPPVVRRASRRRGEPTRGAWDARCRRVKGHRPQVVSAASGLRLSQGAPCNRGWCCGRSARWGMVPRKVGLYS